MANGILRTKYLRDLCHAGCTQPDIFDKKPSVLNVHGGEGASPLALPLSCIVLLCYWSGFSTKGQAIIL